MNGPFSDAIYYIFHYRRAAIDCISVMPHTSNSEPTCHASLEKNKSSQRLEMQIRHKVRHLF